MPSAGDEWKAAAERRMQERDELMEALEDVRARLPGANERADALIARIKALLSS